MFKKNIWFLLGSVCLLGALIVTDFVWDKSYIKHCEIAMCLLNVLFVLRVKAEKKLQVAQCSHCNLFVPFDEGNDKHAGLKPHCCYQKPKG